MSETLIQSYIISSTPEAMFSRMAEHPFVQAATRLSSGELLARYLLRASWPGPGRIENITLAYAYLVALALSAPERLHEAKLTYQLDWPNYIWRWIDRRKAQP